MSSHEVILSTDPVSYWPLDDAASSAIVRDERALRSGAVPAMGVQLAAVPFGTNDHKVTE